MNLLHEQYAVMWINKHQVEALSQLPHNLQACMLLMLCDRTQIACRKNQTCSAAVAMVLELDCGG